MTARDDHPFAGTGDRFKQWSAMCDEIDSLRAEVDDLTNQIDGHQQNYICYPERQEP